MGLEGAPSSSSAAALGAQRLCLRGGDAAHYPPHPGSAGTSSCSSASTPSSSKPPALHSSADPASADLSPSPLPPPLSPHPCDLEDGPAHNALHLYPAVPPPSSSTASTLDACLLPQKASDYPHDALQTPFPQAYPESLEPTVFVGSAVDPQQDSAPNPWCYYKLPRQQQTDFHAPLLPADRLKEETHTRTDTSVTE